MDNGFILTADWHLRSMRPRCRLDTDWIDTQRKALNKIADYAIEAKKCVVCVGDIFHRTIETTFEVIGLVQSMASRLYDNGLCLFILAGNHDLPAHNLEGIHKSAIAILLQSRGVYHLRDITTKANRTFDYGYSAGDFGEGVDDDVVMFIHTLCIPENKMSTIFQGAVTPGQLLEAHDKAKLICTGDYHHNFFYECYDKKAARQRYVINAGCITRQAADMKDYKPLCYDVTIPYEVKVKPLYLPDTESDIITVDYLISENERNDRISAFIEQLKTSGNITFDFVENVYNRIKGVAVEDSVKEIINSLLDSTGGSND
jgi:hypothetical protein